MKVMEPRLSLSGRGAALDFGRALRQDGIIINLVFSGYAFATMVAINNHENDVRTHLFVNGLRDGSTVGNRR